MLGVIHDLEEVLVGVLHGGIFARSFARNDMSSKTMVFSSEETKTRFAGRNHYVYSRLRDIMNI